jgi:hypothetical protein
LEAKTKMKTTIQQYISQTEPFNVIHETEKQATIHCKVQGVMILVFPDNTAHVTLPTDKPCKVSKEETEYTVTYWIRDVKPSFVFDTEKQIYPVPVVLEQTLQSITSA